MRRTLLALSLLLALCGSASAQVGLPWPGPGTPHSAGGGGAVTFVQKAAHDNAASGGTVAVTLNGTAAGNLVALGMFWCDNNSGCGSTTATTITGVASSGGGTCSQGTNAQASTAAGTIRHTDIWYCKNIPGGNATYTVTFSGTVFYAFLGASEWSGLSTTAPDDGVGNSGVQNSNTSLTIATNGNTTNSGELIFSVFNGANALTMGQTALSVNSNSSAGDEYQIAGAAGSYSNSATQSLGELLGSLVAFK